jgi:hypothetical protein
MRELELKVERLRFRVVQLETALEDFEQDVAALMHAVGIRRVHELDEFALGSKALPAVIKKPTIN